MKALTLILLIALLTMGVFLVVAVLLQKSKNGGLSGTIAGGNTDSFLSKDNSVKKDRLLSRLTAAVAVCFAVLILLVYIVQPDYNNTVYTTTGEWKYFSQFYGNLFA